MAEDKDPSHVRGAATRKRKDEAAVAIDISDAVAMPSFFDVIDFPEASWNNVPETVGPIKYCKDKAAVILNLLYKGNTRACAYGNARIDSQTFANWLDRFSDFSECVAMAEDAAEAFHVENLHNFGKADWRASQAWLATRRRKDYGSNASGIDDELRRMFSEALASTENQATAGAAKAIEIRVEYFEDNSTTEVSRSAETH